MEVTKNTTRKWNCTEQRKQTGFCHPIPLVMDLAPNNM